MRILVDESPRGPHWRGGEKDRLWEGKEPTSHGGREEWDGKGEGVGVSRVLR